MKTGIAFQVSAVTKLGSYQERNYMLEVGVWPHKSEHGKAWVCFCRTGELVEDYIWVWNLKLPSLRKRREAVREEA